MNTKNAVLLAAGGLGLSILRRNRNKLKNSVLIGSTPKYSYRWKVTKGKYKGEEMWLPLGQGRRLEKEGFLKLEGKYKLKLLPNDGGTALVKV